MLLQAEKMHKITSISLKMIKVVMLSKNSCHHSPAMVVILSVAQLVTTVTA